jgi:hypothetical protein
MNMSTTTENNSVKKQSSQRRIDASRANGAKSKGPVTPEGLARSSQNARKHSILATHICLSAVEEEIFDRILEQYVNRFQPRDQAEYDLVEEIVYCNFKMRKAWSMESSTLAMQIVVDKDFVDTTWAAPTEHDRQALGLAASVKDGNTIPLLQRYARTLSTQAERAIKTLTDLQEQRIPPAPNAAEPAAGNSQESSIPNDPNPEIEHSNFSGIGNR